MILNSYQEILKTVWLKTVCKHGFSPPLDNQQKTL